MTFILFQVRKLFFMVLVNDNDPVGALLTSRWRLWCWRLRPCSGAAPSGWWTLDLRPPSEPWRSSRCVRNPLKEHTITWEKHSRLQLTERLRAHMTWLPLMFSFRIRLKSCMKASESWCRKMLEMQASISLSSQGSNVATSFSLCAHGEKRSLKNTPDEGVSLCHHVKEAKEETIWLKTLSPPSSRRSFSCRTQVGVFSLAGSGCRTSWRASHHSVRDVCCRSSEETDSGSMWRQAPIL